MIIKEKSDALTKNTLINKTLTLLPNDPKLRQFAEKYCQTIPIRSLLAFATEDLNVYLQNRFEFFKSALKKDDGQIELRKIKKTNDYVLEYVCKDAPFLLVSIEGLLKELNIQIITKFHPILSVEKTEDHTLISVSSPHESNPLYSCTYLRFRDLDTINRFEELKEKITYVFKSVLTAAQYEPLIQDKIQSVKQELLASTLKTTEPLNEWGELIDWLAQGNFIFTGYVPISRTSKSQTVLKEQGLGLLNPQFIAQTDTTILTTLTSHTKRLSHYAHPFIFDTINEKSPMHRRDNLMRLSIKLPQKSQSSQSQDRIIEHNFIGLLRRSSLLVRNMDTPLIHLKMKQIFKSKNMIKGSYDYNEMIRICTATPKFELFRTTAEELGAIVEDLLSITNPNDVYTFFREFKEKNQLLVMVVMPQPLFTSAHIDKIVAYLKTIIPHTNLEVLRIQSNEHQRLQVYFDLPANPSFDIDTQHVDRQIDEIIKPWHTSLKEKLLEKYPGKRGIELFEKYQDAFPPHYQLRRTLEECITDILYLEKVQEAQNTFFNLVPFTFEQSTLKGKASILSFYNPTKMDLITVMPILENLGIHIFDELTTKIGPNENILGYIHSFRVRNQDGSTLDITTLKQPFIELLEKIYHNETDNDPLNALCVKAFLNWRQINILQTYRDYFSQLKPPFGKEKMNAALLQHPSAARQLIQYFETKFSPTLTHSPNTRLTNTLPKIEQTINQYLQSVEDITEDLILKSFLNLIQSTNRTNYYNPLFRPIAIKINSRSVNIMPEPTPFKEIYVHDVGIEGIHLRFGKVARGGLRWSDRHDDYRTEILSLVKTQQTKNVVIVPVGSKGGFVLKRPPENRDAFLKEGQTQYKLFIESLLSVTDTILPNQKIKTPPLVMAYDEADPYLVVAADKGTASFSDLANTISCAKSFWLNDAFASGGSNGYNHKEVGITAKGAWECVKLHFKELGKDIQTEAFTVAGIGDMSGDVFGNGMLLSQQIKLVAAFNHIHIFIDPTPDPKSSWDERHRLFHLPHSTWEDYNKKLISKGGGVFNRKSKSILLSHEIKTLLGTTKDTVTGDELIQLILKSTVDLLWFGGIGTYLKSPSETHLDVRDPANDSVRVNINEVRASVVGEGANLGVTQKARIDFAMNHQRINTDAIDNSAGVNMSDYEVNLKILLEYLLKTNKIPTQAQRNTLLKKATDEVTELVLQNNKAQHRLLSMDTLRSQKRFNIFNKLINHFIHNKTLNPVTESIPDQKLLNEMNENDAPLPRPVLAVIQAYVKMEVYNQLLASEFITSPFLYALYEGYFPKSLLKKFKNDIQHHHLKNEITATLLTNLIINRAGCTFFFEMQTQTGKSIPEIARAYFMIQSCLNATKIWEETHAALPIHDQHIHLLATENTLRELTEDLLLNKHYAPNFSKAQQHFAYITEYKNELTTLLKTRQTQPDTHAFQNSFQSAIGFAIQAEQTEWAVCQETSLMSLFGFGLNEFIYLKDTFNITSHTAILLVVELNRLFHIKWLKNAITELNYTNDWEYENKVLLVHQLNKQKHKILKVLAKAFLDKQKKSSITTDAIHAFFTKKYKKAYNDFNADIQKVKAHGPISHTTLSVLINRLDFI